uniref:Poly [ADP-ribose] polymerase n=1 Tax=Brassica oleracea var. oleracea TaxID=109376 RepID=A0A0D3ASC2_BRAOL
MALGAKLPPPRFLSPPAISNQVRELLPLQTVDLNYELAVMRTWAGSVVNRKQYEKNRELVKLEIVGSWSVFGSRTALCLRSLHQLLSAHEIKTICKPERKQEQFRVNDIPKSSSKVTRDESKLDPQVAKFISLICNVTMMAQQMMELGYNAKELPLGKLSQSTISKGYEVLQRISEMIERYDRARLEELSGEFYTVIPHDFGFKKMSQFVIDTPQKLKQKIEMVEALGEIEFATKLLSIDQGLHDDPLYYHYQQLNCELTPVGADSEEFSMVTKYMENTHAKADSGLFNCLELRELLKLIDSNNSKNRMLLWHGSRLTNWVGILSQVKRSTIDNQTGLRIAPREAPVTGYRFGKGVYFADMFSKSANYCYANTGSNDGVLLLCEVALGDVNELIYPDYEADNLPTGKLSTKGVGKTATNSSEAKTLEEGVVVPLGKPEDHSSTMGMLLYNEYIVYNTEQIKMRYVIQVKFNYK